MDTPTDSRIDSFRQAVERADSLQRRLNTLSVTIFRRDELTGLIERGGGNYDSRMLQEELAASEHPLALRTRRVRMELELREVLAVAEAAMRPALDAITDMVTAAAGGPGAAMSPFVRRHLAELAKNRSAPPVPVTQASRQRRFDIALRDIDASLGALREIRSEVRQVAGNR